MDALDDLLDGARARGAVLGQTYLAPPWSWRFADAARLTLAAMVRGTAWITTAGGQTHRFADGDIAVIRGPEPFVISDRPDSEVQVVVNPGDICTTVDGQDLGPLLLSGPRTCGAGPDTPDLLLTGSYQVAGEASGRLITALPDVLVVRSSELDATPLNLVAAEVARDQPGQQAVLDRLLDLLLVSTLRAWFARPDSHAPSWYLAQGDPVVGEALRLMHDSPEHPWTVGRLAEKAGASRAAFARRFADLVGLPPMGYLAEWRICLAADQLVDTDATVGSIAHRVGYANAYALSVAFTRLRGVRPSEYRARGGPARPRGVLADDGRRDRRSMVTAPP